MTHPLIAPMLAQVAFTAFLYMLLTIARAPKIWGLGRRADGSNPWAGVEPRIAANLSNQFEWPLFFFTACVLLIQFRAEGEATLALAWIFLIGRLLHGAVQILTTNIRLRGLVFTINFLAVLGLWAVLVRTLYADAAS